MRKGLGLMISLTVLTAVISGCTAGKGQEEAAEKEKVTIAFWSDQLTEQYGEYLRKTFPEVDFTFYVATNSTDFYRFKQERGDLPDILTVRRFALRDVADWKDSLMDLSDTELANAFHQSYVRSYTYNDGTVNWLPTCAEVDGILLNKELLEANGIPIPTSYQEFVSVCGALKEQGIRPFVSNFSADFTCMEILQGLSADLLTTHEGREWRQRYESGQTNQLSEEVWLPVFQRMKDFIDYAGILPGDSDLVTNDAFEAYRNKETAMIRATSAEAINHRVEEGSVMMPYYGQTENWYLTYPAFQIAVNARAEETPERKELMLSILEAMLNQEGQQYIATGKDMISYSKEVEPELSSLSENMVPYLEKNQMYIRLASADMFSVSKEVVQEMLSGKYPDARSALDAFNAALEKEKALDPAVFHIDTGYSYDLEPEGGSAAASAIMNSVREEVGTQLLIGPAASVAGNIAAGDYTEAELGFLTMGESPAILLCQMTGEQVRQYVDYVLTTPGKRGSVINDSTLYVASGFEMRVTKNEEGYSLKELTVHGEKLDEEAVWSVAVIGSESMMLQEALAAVGITRYQRTETPYKQIIVNRLAGGKQLAEPTHYITLK